MGKDKVTNTSKEANKDPELMLVTMLGGVSQAIEAQEARGQKELVASDQIPVKMLGCKDDDLAALGFVLRPACHDDPIFRDCTLPKGWSKRPTDHSMWSEVVDERGRKRFGVFYKAAFYDRSAHMEPVCRFTVSTDKYERTGLKVVSYYLTDAGRRVGVLASAKRDDHQEDDRAYSEANRRLSELYPDCDDFRAYWDLPDLADGASL